jgi:hypothetical protein
MITKIKNPNKDDGNIEIEFVDPGTGLVVARGVKYYSFY